MSQHDDSRAGGAADDGREATRPLPLPRRFEIKLFAVGGARPAPDLVRAALHAWIQRDLLVGAPEELLIDVADYAHVPLGPGLMLVGHAEDWCVEERVGGAPGLLYRRKRAWSGRLPRAQRATLADAPPGLADALVHGLERALSGATLLGQVPPVGAGWAVEGAGSPAERVILRVLDPPWLDAVRARPGAAPGAPSAIAQALVGALGASTLRTAGGAGGAWITEEAHEPGAWTVKARPV